MATCTVPDCPKPLQCRGLCPIPLARGGTHTHDNIRPSHARCNMRKHCSVAGEVMP